MQLRLNRQQRTFAGAFSKSTRVVPVFSMYHQFADDTSISFSSLRNHHHHQSNQKSTRHYSCSTVGVSTASTIEAGFRKSRSQAFKYPKSKGIQLRKSLPISDSASF